MPDISNAGSLQTHTSERLLTTSIRRYAFIYRPLAGGVRMRDNKPLWVPSQGSIEASPMYAFMQACNRDHRLAMASYPDLHAWSVSEREAFWPSVWDFCEVK